MTTNADSLRAALEAGLDENPDDLATVMAYADHLSEQGDPRGEFVQVQLRLEDERLKAPERRKLASRERQLLKEHERAWLGPLAPYLLDKDTSHLEEFYAEAQTYAHRWRRGFLASVAVNYLSVRLAQAMADAPCARWLRELRLHDDLATLGEGELDTPSPTVPTPRGVRDHLALFELIGSPCLDNLQILQVGDETGGEEGWTDCHVYVPGLEHVLARVPRVEELILLCKGYKVRAVFGLSTLTRLRLLQVEHLEDYPVSVLAKNPALGNLTHLWFHPHFASDLEIGEDDTAGSYLPLSHLRALVRSPHLKKLSHLRFRMSSAGDEGVRLLIESGFLDQLKLLDLRHGCVTNAGAKLFADYPHLKRLELLDLSRNQLTRAGTRSLRATGAAVRCDHQHPVGSDEYLTEGDFE